MRTRDDRPKALMGTGPSLAGVDLELLCEERWVLGINGACMLAPVQGVVWHDLACAEFYYEGLGDHTEKLFMSEHAMQLLDGVAGKHAEQPSKEICDMVRYYNPIKLVRHHPETDTTATIGLAMQGWDECELYGIDLNEGIYLRHRPAMEFMAGKMKLINCCPLSRFETGHWDVMEWSEG